MKRDIESLPTLCRPSDAGLARAWSERGGYESDDDGPVRIVIGSQTTDEKCERMAARFGLSAAQLIALRDQ